MYAEKNKFVCQFLSDFYVLGLGLMAYSPGIVPQSYEMLGLAAHIRQSSMLGVEVETQKIKLLCEFLLDLHVLGL